MAQDRSRVRAGLHSAPDIPLPRPPPPPPHAPLPPRPALGRRTRRRLRPSRPRLPYRRGRHSAVCVRGALGSRSHSSSPCAARSRLSRVAMLGHPPSHGLRLCSPPRSALQSPQPAGSPPVPSRSRQAATGCAGTARPTLSRCAAGCAQEPRPNGSEPERVASARPARPARGKAFEAPPRTRAVICSACERRRHYECIDCLSDHSTYKCSCECHDENTPPHSVQAHGERGGKEPQE